MFIKKKFTGTDSNGKKIYIVGKFKKINVTTTACTSNSYIISPLGDFHTEDGRRVQHDRDDFYKPLGSAELYSCPDIAKYTDSLKMV